MKLELKHLAGYLPYGLRVMWDDGQVRKINPLIDETDYEKNEISLSLALFVIYKEDATLKPILHPLSDLTKEIEVNGEKFVPIEKIEFLYTFEKRNDFPISMYIDGSWVYKCENLPYDLVQKLYEWHFDIHNLIENGLAIDINTLNK